MLCIYIYSQLFHLYIVDNVCVDLLMYSTQFDSSIPFDDSIRFDDSAQWRSSLRCCGAERNAPDSSLVAELD